MDSEALMAEDDGMGSPISTSCGMIKTMRDFSPLQKLSRWRKSINSAQAMFIWLE